MRGLKNTAIHKVTLRYNGLACFLLHVQAFKKSLPVSLFSLHSLYTYSSLTLPLLYTHTHTHTHTHRLYFCLSLHSAVSHTHKPLVSWFISLPPPSDPPSSAHKHTPSVAASHTLCLFHSRTRMLPADLSHFLSSCVHMHLTHLLPSPVHTHTLLD